MVPVTDKIWKKWNLGMGLKNLCLLTYILEVHVSRSLKLSTFYVFLKQASDPKAKGALSKRDHFCTFRPILGQIVRSSQ